MKCRLKSLLTATVLIAPTLFGSDILEVSIQKDDATFEIETTGAPPLKTLPAELISYYITGSELNDKNIVFGYLDAKSLGGLAMVNKAWATFLNPMLKTMRKCNTAKLPRVVIYDITDENRITIELFNSQEESIERTIEKLPLMISGLPKSDGDYYWLKSKYREVLGSNQVRKSEALLKWFTAETLNLNSVMSLAALYHFDDEDTDIGELGLYRGATAVLLNLVAYHSGATPQQIFVSADNMLTFDPSNILHAKTIFSLLIDGSRADVPEAFQRKGMLRINYMQNTMAASTLSSD